jgi:hypothetical protein
VRRHPAFTHRLVLRDPVDRIVFVHVLPTMEVAQATITVVRTGLYLLILLVAAAQVAASRLAILPALSIRRHLIRVILQTYLVRMGVGALPGVSVYVAVLSSLIFPAMALI